MAKAKYDGRKNLIPVHDHETAVMLGKRSAEARREKKNQKAMLLEDIKNTVTERIKVPEPLYQTLKGLGIKITRLERVDKLIFYRALLKALKDGEPDRLLKIAEFAGMKFRDDDEGSATSMTPDTELMLSTLFAQGRKVEPPPQVDAPAEGDADFHANGEGGSAPAEPSITVFSGLG
ncbi:hypothetical protein [uncultured Fibrobacter sp.]|uniref:hypothetical protein n=1 Tax=uncultured Fibrobacter sp. TaxID=261512 RepID=UPI0025E269AC|nr:hypothetical protein [uncultured Fibrobacter sp.]